MNWAGRHQRQIPNSPPQGMVAQTTRTDSGVAIIQLMSPDQHAQKGSAFESLLPLDGPITHAKPFGHFQAQYVGKRRGAILSLQSARRYTSQIGQPPRTAVTVRVCHAA